MNTISSSINLVLRKTTIILFILFSSISIYSQNFQADISFGTHNTKYSFTNQNSIKVYDNITNGSGNTYSIGLTSKLSAHFYLRSELGFSRTNSHIRIDYGYRGGFPDTLKSKVLSIGLINEKVYLSLLPEFRYSFKSIDIFINGGVTMASDIKNTFDNHFGDLDDVYIPGEGIKNILGFGFNGGLNYNIGSIAIRLNSGAMFFGKEQLFNNSYHPDFSYRNINVSLGIVYSVGDKIE